MGHKESKQTKQHARIQRGTVAPWARTLILATGSTQEEPSLYNWKIVDGT